MKQFSAEKLGHRSKTVNQLRSSTSSIVAHLTFGLLLFILGLVAHALLDALSINGALAGALFVGVIVIPGSILLSKRFGRLTLGGVALTAVAVSLASQAIAIEILDWVARPAGGHVTWGSFIGQGFGMQTAIGTAVIVAAAVAWLLVLNRASTRES